MISENSVIIFSIHIQKDRLEIRKKWLHSTKTKWYSSKNECIEKSVISKWPCIPVSQHHKRWVIVSIISSYFPSKMLFYSLHIFHWAYIQNECVCSCNAAPQQPITNWRKQFHWKQKKKKQNIYDRKSENSTSRIFKVASIFVSKVLPRVCFCAYCKRLRHLFFFLYFW